jgi:hypothetical protein
MDNVCVLCTVGTEFLYVTYAKSSLKFVYVVWCSSVSILGPVKYKLYRKIVGVFRHVFNSATRRTHYK